MKLIINKILFFATLVLISSCSRRLIQISILNIDHKHIEVKNGNRQVFWGFTGGSNMNDQNIIFYAPINFRDSIFIEIFEKEKQVLSRSYKLTRGKYLYIDNLTGEFSVYSQKKEKAIY